MKLSEKNGKMSEAQELNTLVGVDETITVGGRTLTVNRIRMRQLPKVLELMQPIIGIIMVTSAI